MVAIMVPDLGKGIDKVQVVAWHAKVGDRVRQDEDIVELVTDKAVFNVPAPAAGTLKKIDLPPGREAPVGAVLGFID